jgi:hypothetical protein
MLCAWNSFPKRSTPFARRRGIHRKTPISAFFFEPVRPGKGWKEKERELDVLCSG